MLVNDKSLEAVAALASEARSQGKTYVHVDLEPKRGGMRYVQLWEGIVGLVVGRRFADSVQAPNPDLPSQRRVQYVTVRVNIVDVFEALRRVAARNDRLIAAPLRANTFVAEIPPTTAR